jgi:uncharacterized protein
MIDRQALAGLHRCLARQPATVLLGPRQVGKSTLAQAVAQGRPGTLFLDLERPSDQAMLAQPELLLPLHRHALVVLDEVQHAPGLFAALRPEIDADRRPGRFLLLGSASGELLRQSAESLAGRVAYCELPPVRAQEWPNDLQALQTLWLRGGYPLSLLAADDQASLQWRLDLVQTLLQRDLQALGLRLPAETLRRFWTMLAHLQGQLFNATQLGQSLGGLAHTTVNRWLDLLCDLMLVRRLPPFAANVGKRLVKSPKVYVRDSGLVHALLGLGTVQSLQGHPVVGASWEGFVVEQLAAALPPDATLAFYRTAAGAEMDLVVERGQRRLALEVKFSAAPKPARGFWQALTDLRPQASAVVAPVARAYPLADGVQVLPVWQLPGWLDAELNGG